MPSLFPMPCRHRMAQKPPKKAEPLPEGPAEPGKGALVPFYGVPAIPEGVQAFRRGDLILYTVRGEPKEVQELMDRLDKDGVREVVALVSHGTEEEPIEVEDRSDEAGTAGAGAAEE